MAVGISKLLRQQKSSTEVEISSRILLKQLLLFNFYLPTFFSWMENIALRGLFSLLLIEKFPSVNKKKFWAFFSFFLPSWRVSQRIIKCFPKCNVKCMLNRMWEKRFPLSQKCTYPFLLVHLLFFCRRTIAGWCNGSLTFVCSLLRFTSSAKWCRKCSLYCDYVAYVQPDTCWKLREYNLTPFGLKYLLFITFLPFLSHYVLDNVSPNMQFFFFSSGALLQ